MSVGAGMTLGAYRLLQRVGKGGMGEVYRAQHLKLGRQAAIKVLPANLANEAEFLKRFEREAASAASLNHPNILPVWDYGEQAGVPYLVMPYVAGGTLKDRLGRDPLPRPKILHYLRQMAEALDYAHERGIVHRDVKPANMLLDERDRLYLADFGIAKALEGSEGLTKTGIGVGTPEYMAPEQAQGHADARSDLYALGIIAYQMLTGRVPYSGMSAVEVLMKHLQDPLPVLPLRGATPPSVERVLQKALAKNPNERYQTGAGLVEALGEALAERPTVTAPPPDHTVVGPPSGANWSAPPTTSGWGTPGVPGYSSPGGYTPPPNFTPPPGGTPPGYPPPVGWTGSQPAYTPLPAGALDTGQAARPGWLLPALVGGALVLLLAVVGLGLVAGSRGGSQPTATVAAEATNTAPVVAAASPTPATAPTPTSVPAPVATYPSGGKYSTLDPVGKRGGHVTEAVNNDAKVLNPMISTDSGSDAVEQLLFNALVSVNPDTGLPYPDLATEVPTLANGGISQDGLTYTFKLRRDVKWHDGQPFTAKDVVFTYTTMAKPELGSPSASAINERIASVTAPDDFTVVFKLKKIVAPFLITNMYPIVPEHILGSVPVDQIKTHPFSTGDSKATVGTGPFRFKEWVKGDHLTLAKNTNYFRGEPALDEYTFKVVPDSTALVNGLKNGEIDYGQVYSDLYIDMSNQPNLRTVSYDTFGFTYYAYQLDPAKTTLFQDKAVRQALAYAIDRDKMIKQLNNGLAQVAQGTMPLPSWAYAPEQLKVKYTYDPQKAEQLLDQAGWRKGPDGIRAKGSQKLAFTISTNTGGNEALAQYLQQQWEAIGVEATPQAEEFGAYLTRITETHDFEMALVSFTWGVDPDQTAMWATQSYPTGFNMNKYSNPQVDQLLAKALGELDQNQRKQAYIEMQNLILDDAPSVLLEFNQTAVAVNKRVHNLKPNAINTRWNAQTWWVEDGK